MKISVSTTNSERKKIYCLIKDKMELELTVILPSNPIQPIAYVSILMIDDNIPGTIPIDDDLFHGRKIFIFFQPNSCTGNSCLQ
ncbi:hypothetical protein RIR_jg4615.t1 [Rhizophagus irregularis DAOM 181602=DAOM 197198]|nr:hypothetical protein RIR_jg4615.t1 [Rhizophagus irregularis DAOM 181602=DAOM 197198]